MTEHRVVVERRSGRPGQRGSALVRALVWLVVGAAVTLLLVVDPFGVSPVDGWLGVQRMVGVGHGDGGGHGEAHEAGLWTCSMHPQVIEAKMS